MDAVVLVKRLKASVSAFMSASTSGCSPVSSETGGSLLGSTFFIPRLLVLSIGLRPDGP